MVYFGPTPPPQIYTDSFIFLDGKFRFIGMNGRGFWDPTKVQPPNDSTVSNRSAVTDLSNLCRKDVKQITIWYPEDQIIHRVDPVYPDEARKKLLEGDVYLRLEVAKDGSVKTADYTEGCEIDPSGAYNRFYVGGPGCDPLLVGAAKIAVKQWRFKPFTNCGKPVEMQVREVVHFSLK